MRLMPLLRWMLTVKKTLPKLLEPLYQQNGIWLPLASNGNCRTSVPAKPRSTYDTQAGILREDSDIHTIVDLIRPKNLGRCA